jgi:hypothetical protein
MGFHWFNAAISLFASSLLAVKLFGPVTGVAARIALMMASSVA